MIFIAWNVDSYNDIIHSWVKRFIEANNPDVMFFSETKATYEQLEQYFNELTNYNYIINVHNPRRYHGVAMLIKKEHKYVHYDVDLKIPTRKDSKSNNAATGRIITILLEDKYYIVGAYTPNSGMRDDKTTKLPYRINVWDPAFFTLLNMCKQNKPTIWMGDINVAPNDIDVSNPKQMSKWAGFRPEERASLEGFLNKGEWVDIWRYQHPETIEYSWRGNSPKPNYGLRLDNVIITADLVSKVTNSFMLHECIPNSDHIPVGIQIE